MNEDQKIISKIHANKELKKEMDLDFEEISDGELEEESRIKGIGDALGVDWESLAKETQRPIIQTPDVFSNSTKARWTPHRILWDIGISVNLAGEEFARRMLTEARDELRREKQEHRMKLAQTIKDSSALVNGGIKKEPNDEILNGQTIKNEPMDVDDTKEEQQEADKLNIEEPEDDFDQDDDVLTHPIAHIQVYKRKLLMKRKNLIIHSPLKYGRALSARRDLQIRRQLCNLPTRDVNIDRNCIINQELHQRVDRIYQKLVGEVS